MHKDKSGIGMMKLQLPRFESTSTNTLIDIITEEESSTFKCSSPRSASDNVVHLKNIYPHLHLFTSDILFCRPLTTFVVCNKSDLLS